MKLIYNFENPNNSLTDKVSGKNTSPGEMYSTLSSEGIRIPDEFVMECEAMRIVRDDMGLDNVKLMIPFCRTPKEGEKVLKAMQDNDLKQGENGL